MDNKFSFSENTSEHISDIKDYLIRIISNWKWFVLAILVVWLAGYILFIMINNHFRIIEEQHKKN